MERSRIRTLLGLALIVFGALALAHALTRPALLAPNIAPAMPDMPKMPAMPDMPPLPDMPKMPDLPPLPELPPPPDLPPLPAAPQPPHEGFWTHSGWLNPATILLLVILLLVWRRGRASRERPLA